MFGGSASDMGADTFKGRDLKRFRAGLASAVMLAALGLRAGPAPAGDAPRVGPVPAWINAPPPITATKDDPGGLPVAMLLNDTQFSFDGSGWTEYHALRAKVQATAGLQALSAIPFQWSPWSDDLIFHRARILRDGQAIDILPKDGGFTVLRRETGLEQAMLTGQLTALLQPEGLRVGDVLDLAVSIRHADPLFKGRTGAVFEGWDAAPVDHVRFEARWPSSLPVRWRESASLPPLRRVEANGVTRLSLELDHVLPPVPPAHAPARYLRGRNVEFTTFADWRELARVVAPLFAKAAALGPQSPVAAEARAIAKTAATPEARIKAALRLVQSDVRYLAHVEAANGYTPQSADETWRLRYGDCKAKTVLLLALLRELGVAAEPALANVAGGDGFDSRLPSPLLFDHVLVRATVEGRVYWLDGTRQGDLDPGETAAYGWVLPMGGDGGTLVHVVADTPARPQMREVIRYDASSGVTAPAGTHFETTFRGDGAVALHEQLSAVPSERLNSALQAYWSGAHTAFTPTRVSAAWNPDTGEETLVADGTSKLDWSGAGLELQNVEFGGAPDIKRDPAASDPDAPFVVAFPMYVETEETVVMPPSVTPTAESLKRADVDEVIAGVAYRRFAQIDGRLVRVVASQRGVEPEISAAVARGSVERLKTLGEQGIYLTAGPHAKLANDAAWLDSHPTTVDGHVDRGSALLDAGRYKEAVAEYDAAIALDPRSQTAWAGRAVAHAWMSDPAAIADADKADTLGAPEIVAARARAILAATRGDRAGARAGFRRALAIRPDDTFSLDHLVQIEIGDLDLAAARQDLETLQTKHPELASTVHYWRAMLASVVRDKDGARRELSQYAVVTADDRLTRARAYIQIGDTELARADIEAAIALEPTARAWLLEAGLDGGLSNPKGRSDIDEALKVSPDDLDAGRWKVEALTTDGDFAAALATADRLVGSHPDAMGDLMLRRAAIHLGMGRRTEMEADFARARDANVDIGSLCHGEVDARARPETALGDCEAALSKAPTSPSLRMDAILLLHRLGRAQEADSALSRLRAPAGGAMSLNNICYSLAAEGFHLQEALADCNASLRLDPRSPATLDSRAFTLMRLGRNAEALAAYDAALAAAPKLYIALYGRGLVKKRLGRVKEGEHDQSEALAASPGLRERFARMGISE